MKTRTTLRKSTFVAPPRCSSPNPAAAVQQFPNICFYGQGFDLLKTDPLNYPAQANGKMVLEVELADTPPAGQNFLFPKHTDVTAKDNTIGETTSQQIFRASDYQSTVAASASVDAGIPGVFSFSLSSSFMQATSTSSSFATSTFYTWRRFEIVTVSPTEGAPTTPSGDLKQVVATLPTDSDQGEYQQLIDDFGTHYLSQVTFGGQVHLYSTVSASSYSSMISKQIDISAGVQGLFDFFSAGASGSLSDSNAQAIDDATLDQNSFFTASGGAFFTTLDEWAKSVPEQPVPVEVTMTPISSILSADNFPDDPDIATKQSMLEQAVSDYLSQNGESDDSTVIDGVGVPFGLQASDGSFLAWPAGSDGSPSENTALGVRDGLDGDGQTTSFRYNGDGPLPTRTPVPISSNSVAGNVELSSDGSAWQLGNNDKRQTAMLVSAFDDPTSGDAPAVPLPSGGVQIGDQVYVMDPDMSAAMSSKLDNGAPSATGPNIGDSSQVWTVVSVG